MKDGGGLWPLVVAQLVNSSFSFSSSCIVQVHISVRQLMSVVCTFTFTLLSVYHSLTTLAYSQLIRLYIASLVVVKLMRAE